jgi:hypothetical protein
MTWAKWILAYLFDCVHLKTTWPQRGRNGLNYVCCLECGKEFPYSTQLMSIVSKEEQMKEWNPYGWTGRANARSSTVMRSSGMVSMDTLVR